MKKFLSIITAAFFIMLISCNNNAPDNTSEPDPSTVDFVIDGTELEAGTYAFYEKALQESNQEVYATFSAKMFVINENSSSINLMWQVNTSSYPIVAMKSFSKGITDWTTVSGSTSVSLATNNAFYLSTYGITDVSKVKIYVKDFKLSIEGNDGTTIYTATSVSQGKTTKSDNNWTSDKVDSLYETYKNYFDTFGLAIGNTELTSPKIQEGLIKHVNTITMGNEFKPDFVFAWAWGQVSDSNLKDFTSSKNVTIKVPSNIPSFASQDAILQKCKDLGLKMRGHVLVWHSQTPKNFFRENYKENGSLVDIETMEARQEWYIKTVIEHVQNWEEKNNNGEHIIWAWDVVNEAASDNGTNLRTGNEGSDWYSIYKNDKFIVDAFRYANKYAASDVLLCYNDYNCLIDAKRAQMIKIVDAIIAAQTDSTLPSRINAMGIQSHISVNNTAAQFENAIKAFTAKGIDVQVTELDIATETKYDANKLADSYKALFTTLIKNRKTDTKHGVSSITIWGINDESTWLNTPSQMQWHGNTTQYPLLFEKNDNGEIVTKKAFDAVINAAKDYTE